MNSDDGPRQPRDDDAAERFARALDGSVEDDPDLADEIALARRLGALAPSLDPEPGARERARQRLLAALAREARPDDDPSRAS